jgi:hypothetical protein
MSVTTLWEQLYFDTSKELDAMRRRLSQQCHEERMRVIALEGQRLTLLSHLTISANLLKVPYPIVAERMLEVVNELRTGYETAKPTVAELVTREAGSVAGTVPGHSGAERGTPVHTEAGPAKQAPF